MTNVNTQRNYAHEVVTDVMHNAVPNLITAQRARDQAEYLRELNAELVAALQDIVREPQGKTVADNAKVLSAVIRIARAALAKAGAA